LTARGPKFVERVQRYAQERLGSEQAELFLPFVNQYYGRVGADDLTETAIEQPHAPANTTDLRRLGADGFRCRVDLAPLRGGLGLRRTRHSLQIPSMCASRI
jgi:hypothetical protein